MNKIKSFSKIISFAFFLSLPFWLPNHCSAMPPGVLVYRNYGGGKMYGYSGDPLMVSEKGIIKDINSGHAGIYIGKEDGIDYVVEALSGGIVKTPADKFVNEAEGEKYLGAKIPKGLSALRQAKVVALAKSLVGQKLAYDFDFKKQKGPGSGEWTCVGLTEKLYESADISNPNNLNALEYDFNYYAIDITADGFDNYSVVNSLGDCFSRDLEFSKIARRQDLLLPAPELIGYDLGLEKNGERYIFLPYTQFLQPTLDNVSTDIKISSSFSGVEVRGAINNAALVLRWSLLNNPISSIKILAQKTKDLVVNIKNSIFGSGSEGTELAITTIAEEIGPKAEIIAKTGVIVNKAIKTVAKKSTSTPANVKSDPVKTNSVTVSKALAPTSVKTSVTSTKTTGAKTTDVTTKVAANTKSSSSVSTYYNPISTPAITVANNSSSGASGSWNSPTDQATDNTPKIATINKIYSTGNNNWIELYNTGDYDFDLATAAYRLEKAKTAEDPSLIMRIGDTIDGSYPGGTVIKAHSSYLIVKSTADNYYLSKADAIATREDFVWPGSAYTIYLGTGAITSNIDADIVEAIGFGPDATYFQGSAPAPEIIDNYILKRIKNTGDNRADFDLIKSDDPSIDWAALSEANASSTENIATSTEKAATSTEEVGTTTDEIATSTENIATNTTAISSSSLILINKVYSTGNNDWIELYNPNNYDFDLAANTYRLEKAKTSEDPDILMRIGDLLDGTYPGGTVIKAHSSYLIVRSEANDFYKSQADAIATRTDFSWLDSGYTFYLGNGPISSSTDSSIIDLVGFGSDATYWQGIGPAAAIKDNYFLNRIATSSNNNLDFNLIKSDDPNINWQENSTDTSDTTNGIYKFSAASYNLFPQPSPLDSSGLIYLWHFDECSGLNSQSAVGSAVFTSKESWRAGKFVCAKELGPNYDKLRNSLDAPIDVNNFSLSFWFRKTDTYPRLSLTLANSNDDSINITLEDGLMQFAGLPNANWRYFQPFPFDDTWRQATLVINRNEGYWAFYVDGIEKMHIESYKLFPYFNILELGGNNGPYALDELAIWDRALTEDEVINLRNREQPFNPFIVRSPQKKPVLKHFWNFNEGIGTSSSDLIGDADLLVDKDSWNNLDLVNSSLIVDYFKKVKAKIPVLESPDLSLTFWWRSPDITSGNRINVALRDTSNNTILAVSTNQGFSAYNFNNNYVRFNPPINLDTNWHQFAVVYDSYRNLASFYADGVLKDSRSFIWSGNHPLADSLELVSENGVCEIDNLGIWEGALSSAQIAEILANN
jgi:hypothetical protein